MRDRQFAEEEVAFETSERHNERRDRETAAEEVRRGKTRFASEDYETLLIKLNEAAEEQRVDLFRAFQVFDKDHDGELTYDELANTFKVCNIELVESELNLLFAYGDEDGSGKISF